MTDICYFVDKEERILFLYAAPDRADGQSRHNHTRKVLKNYASYSRETLVMNPVVNRTFKYGAGAASNII